MKLTKVKVIKCSVPSYWYRNYIGHTFIVRDIVDGQSDYMVIDSDGELKIVAGTKFIYVQDCMTLQEIREEKLNELTK